MNSDDVGLRNVLVPLDGSELAERALAVATRVAKATNSGIVLAQVIPVATWAFAIPDGLTSAEHYDQLLSAEDRTTQHYLSDVAERLQREGLVARTRLVRGDPGTKLVDLEGELRVGMVVMATHGRTGVARFALGSVADRVARTGHVPVLLVRPFGEDERNARLERALVPLDGSEVAEAGLTMAAQLAGPLWKHVLLARVVDPSWRSGETEEAQRYLSTARDRFVALLEGRPCEVATTVLYGKPAEQIIERAERDYDVVIMSTHGRTGADRWAYGSVADGVLKGLSIPLLLVRTPYF
jgi:nucleotide-binding universal stress UspA family protein